MGWILTIIIGGILGWLASKVMKTDAQQGIILNIVVGVVGAALAGFLISPLLGIPTINAANFSIGGLVISFLGALILLAIVNSSVAAVFADKAHWQPIVHIEGPASSLAGPENSQA